MEYHAEINSQSQYASPTVTFPSVSPTENQHRRLEPEEEQKYDCGDCNNSKYVQQIFDATFDSYIVPSENLVDDRIEVTNQTGENNMLPKAPKDFKYGKWLIFRPWDEIDSMFKIIREATIAGELGYSSSVSTRRSTTHWGYNMHVICVFTYDEDDFEDIMRVRRALELLGIIETLRYKTCHSTWLGRYYHCGHRNFIKYSA